MKKILKYVFIFALALLGLISGTMQVEANNSITITNAGTRRGGVGSPYFASSVANYTIQCGHGHLLPPFAYNVPTTVKFSDLEEITDQTTRKVAYYGWGGPKEWSGLANINVMTQNGWDYGVAPRNTAGYHATHWALNNAWHNVNPKAGNSKSFEAELQPFTDYLNTQPNAPQGYKVYVYKTGAGAQDLIIYSNESVESQLTLKKTSANKNLTEIATAGYSLAGAEYGVYSTKQDADSDRNRLATFTTDASGNSNTVSLTMNQTYYVKEVKAPKGFYLDENRHEVYLDGDKTIHVEDKPKFDPLVLMLRKNDGNGKLLEGSHFEVKYYAGAFDTVESLTNQTALKTWVFKTNQNGIIEYKDTYKVSGDELFKDSNGVESGLIGTYTFKEIKAPTGYVLDSTVYISQIKEDGTVTDPNGDGTIYNAPIISNSIIQGKIAITKQMDKNVNGRIADGQKVAGSNIEFEIVDKQGVVVETITTNENGYAESNLLDYGVYTVKEKASDANQGYQLVKDFTVEIKENNKVYHYALENFIKQSKLKIVKIDAATKQTIALAGFEFKLKDAQGNYVKQVVSYPSEKEIEVFTTDATGSVQLPEHLVYGAYTIEEVALPENSGYLINYNTLKVQITGEETLVTLHFANDPTPAIKTEAHGEGQQVRETVEPKEKNILIENTFFERLTKDETYKVAVDLVDLATKQVIGTQVKEFTATETTLKMKFEFEVVGWDYPQGTTFTEKLYRKNQKGEWELIVYHNEKHDDKDQTIIFKKYGKLTVKKVDANDQTTVLEGAEFTLYRDGIEIAKGASGKDGIVVFEKLIEGVEYELKETNAPVGYLLPKESKKIILTAEQLEKEEVFEVPNSLLPIIKKEVKTGDSSNVFAYAIAAMLAVVGLFVLRKKED